MVVTAFVFGESAVLRAKSQEQLARQVYLHAPFWSREACALVALHLARGRVVVAPDFEAVLLPGDFGVLQVRPAEDPSWSPGVPA